MEVIRKRKKPTIQLTSLLDLLFIMIFISLLQTKEMPTATEREQETTQKVVEKPTEIEEAKESTESPILQITAIFHFHSTPENPEVPTGTFAMQGEFNSTDGTLSLGGVSWINRPSGYDMIPLHGVISQDQRELTGRIEFPGCEEFTLRRTSLISSSSPISGSWEGVYRCTQGTTGLSLTIQ